MIPAAFDYVRPADLGQALRILKERGGSAKVLAGGYSLLPLLKLRLAEPELLVDLRDIGGLEGITENAGELRIGARATHAQIATNPVIRDRYHLLAEAASHIADPQVRNWGTIGGSCAHADPTADWPAVLIASRGSLVCRNFERERSVPAREFFIDTFQTAIDPSEILTEIRVPAPGRRQGSAYENLERRAGDFSTVGVAVVVRLDGFGKVAEAGIGLTAVADTPFAATDAERVLEGAEPGDDLFRAAGSAAAGQSKPASDAHGPAEYKRAMVAELTVRALRRAVERARAQAQ